MTMKFHLSNTADEIATMRGAIRRCGDYEALREYCDMLTCSDLDSVQLDILTDMVDRRIRVGASAQTIPVVNLLMVDQA